MSNPNNGSVNVTVVTQQDTPSFLSSPVDFKKLSKELSKLSKVALETLESLLASADEKMRFQAAKTILELDLSLKDKINQDQMQRLIAEVKVGRGPQVKTLTVDEEKPKRPVVDFTSIRQID